MTFESCYIIANCDIRDREAFTQRDGVVGVLEVNDYVCLVDVDGSILGIDHKQLTFRFGGRDVRLTDVEGHVLHDILS
ncbi:DUF1501 domain-containing protein [bacterium]|nr:DUF1501 domain-containing protein [bacterium]